MLTVAPLLHVNFVLVYLIVNWNTYVLMFAVGKAVASLMLTSCSTPVLQQPALAIAVVTPVTCELVSGDQSCLGG